MKWLQDITGGYSSSAKVVGNTLVLSLPDASAPVVWRMDLSEIKSSAFEVKQTPDGFMLVMKTAKGSEQQIAPFESKAGAMKALMAASGALEHASAGSNGNAPAEARSAKAGGGKKSGQLLSGLIGVALLAGIIFMIVNMGPKLPGPPAGQNMASTAGNPAETGGSSGTPGVPVSADEFLRSR